MPICFKRIQISIGLGKASFFSTRHVWHLIKKYLKLVGIGYVLPHDGKHSSLQTTGSDPAIQRMSGHQDLKTLRLYELDRENLEDNAINELSYDEVKKV